MARVESASALHGGGRMDGHGTSAETHGCELSPGAILAMLKEG